MLAVKLDDSGLVEYFGHHYSSLSNYRKTSNPVPTPDGEKIMFKSDFGDTSTEVVYVFEAQKYQNTDIYENQNIAIEISPNPVIDYMKISTNEIIKGIKIYNSLGQIVKFYDGKNKKSIILNLSELKLGVYTLVINNQMKKMFIKK